jgi:16S rRNA (cytosine1402-N4)-methyltransferase
MQEHVRERGMTPAGTHVPVLMSEVMEALRPAPGETVADCTLGYGGHALEFLRRTAPDGLLVGFDVDARELERTRARLLEHVPAERLSLHRSNYAGLAKVLGGLGIDGYDVVFADLGVSSMQIDDPRRGFTYKHAGPLDMRMDDRIRRTAADLLAKMSVEELSAALWELADEPAHDAIARTIADRRRRHPLRTTDDLVDVVFQARGLSRRGWRRGEGEPHPAALTFQALRILVNDELASLRELLRVVPYCLRPGGRVGIISFHSGEDRLVKEALRAGQTQEVYASTSEEVIRATPDERRANPRSAPARFRWAVRT